ncbi:MAG: DUF2683 family protein [Nitrososphaerota archaeon]|jgi:hypothetical protein|uniref:DUF2683 family protein n=1 Tax=Candidatus Bathycorpusculum sp. TaxID=2994959 RepID=UPI0028211AD6|nr:DUF2683 family protein [Candidatus Termiticorpusculum sp.]MCL2258037.1 DUF2683 family protein [Candidatus Termiticorpusculum sp.]MCL2291741.1 DUF2683 family protein [Candidatus Termiticorpusculum sp.]MDR0460734.1 DUF2683 family protein [Nitrososphaerota archaeon]
MPYGLIAIVWITLNNFVLYGVMYCNWNDVSMVKNVIELGEEENRVINIVKAKYGFKDKSQALSVIIKRYGESELEPQLRPEFVAEIEETLKSGKFVKVKDFEEEYGLK